MKNKIISIIVLLTILLSVSSCNKAKDENKPVEFTDFTVERCVRKQLGKGWDEEITIKELETITMLCISSMYDPTFGNPNVLYEVGYLGYLDLSDLKYLTNLEVLKLDTYGYQDNIVNLETITECKKLEKLYFPADSFATSFSINPLGYKYLNDIISELPNLKFLDLGMYFDEHMEEFVLSEIDNKDLEIYYGDIDEDYYYKTKYVSGFRQVSLISKDDMFNVNYEQAWDYEYKSIKDKIENYGIVFPAIYADNMEDLTRELEQISDTAEDIIIVYKGLDEIDFNLFDRFPNLVTLSIFATKFGQDRYFNETTELYEFNGYKGAKAVNLDSLSENKDLQVLNLGGFIGDLSDISKIQNLRELYIKECAIDSVDFIGEMDTIKELLIGIWNRENTDEIYIKLDEQVSKLKNLKCYIDFRTKAVEDANLYENINDMESLETLIVYDTSYLHNIVNSKTVKNLLISGIKEFSEISFDEMEKLECLVLHGQGESYITNIDYMSIVDLPNIKTVVYPIDAAEYENLESVLTYELAQKIAKNESISAFVAKSSSYGNAYTKYVDINFIEQLYEAGVDDGICQQYIENGWKSGNNYTYDDYYEYWNKIKK